MNGSKDTSGGRGIGSGLRGGKAKRVVGRHNDHAIVNVNVPDPNRDDGDVESERRRSKKSNLKHPSENATVEKNKIWTHGPYMMVSDANGKITSYRRSGTSGSSQVGEGARMTEFDGESSEGDRMIDSDDEFGEGDQIPRDNDGSDNGNEGSGGGGDDGGDDGDVGIDGREFIKYCNGKSFGDVSIHKRAREILDQSLDGDWVTFKMVPKDVTTRMFERFRKRYRWDPQTDQLVYDTFIDVIKRRFRDIMCKMRQQSKVKAKLSKHAADIPDVGDNFDIQCNFAPDSVPLEKWQRMCKLWNTEKWKERSNVGRNNHKSDLCRHTGGSIGFDQHRRNLEKQEGKKVGFRKVLLQTHATKECKKRLRDGDIKENDFDNLEFINDHARCSYVSYVEQLEKLYGENTNCDDIDVWRSLHPKSHGRQLFGVGSSDPLYVVTGTPSSASHGSNNDTQQSHEVSKVQAELEKEREARQTLEILCEKEREARLNLEIRYEREREEEREARLNLEIRYEREREEEREARRLERKQDQDALEAWKKKLEETLKSCSNK